MDRVYHAKRSAFRSVGKAQPGQRYREGPEPDPAQTAPYRPKNRAVTPLSNSPGSSFDAPMNKLATADTLPRIVRRGDLDQGPAGEHRNDRPRREPRYANTESGSHRE